MKKFIRIGVDLAKNYFQVHALESENGPAVTRKLKRSKMHEFFSQIEPCLVGMEACGSAHYWARELKAMGHEVLLMPPNASAPRCLRRRKEARSPRQGAFIRRDIQVRVWQAQRDVMNDTVATEGREQPAKCHERKARSPDRDPGRRTSSRPADICSASTGRTYDRSRPNRSQRQKSACQGRPSTYGAASPALTSQCSKSVARRGAQMRRSMQPRCAYRGERRPPWRARPRRGLLHPHRCSARARRRLTAIACRRHTELSNIRHIFDFFTTKA